MIPACVDGSCIARSLLTLRRMVGCAHVSGLFARHATAGFDGGPQTKVPKHHRALMSAEHYSGCPCPRLDRFAITS